MSFNERLEFLFKSTETLHASMHDAQEEQERRWKKKDGINLLIANVNRTDSQVEKLTKVIAAIGQTVLDHQDWIEKHS